MWHFGTIPKPVISVISVSQQAAFKDCRFLVCLKNVKLSPNELNLTNSFASLFLTFVPSQLLGPGPDI